MSVSFYARNGFGSVELPAPHDFVNFANANAAAVLQALGLWPRRGSGADALCGQCTVEQARRATLYAFATLPATERTLTRETTRRGRITLYGLDAAGLRSRVEQVAAFVEAAAAAGATFITWS